MERAGGYHDLSIRWPRPTRAFFALMVFPSRASPLAHGPSRVKTHSRLPAAQQVQCSPPATPLPPVARVVLSEALPLPDDMSRACIRLSPAFVRALEDVTDVSAMAGSLAALAFNPAGDISTDLVHRLDDLPPARPQGAGGRMARVTRSVSSRGVGDVGSLAAHCRVRAVVALPPVPMNVAGAEALAAGALVGSTVLISADEMAHAVSHTAVWAPSPEALALAAGVALAADGYAEAIEVDGLLTCSPTRSQHAKSPPMIL